MPVEDRTINFTSDSESLTEKEWEALVDSIFPKIKPDQKKDVIERFKRKAIITKRYRECSASGLLMICRGSVYIKRDGVLYYKTGKNSFLLWPKEKPEILQLSAGDSGAVILEFNDPKLPESLFKLNYNFPILSFSNIPSAELFKSYFSKDQQNTIADLQKQLAKAQQHRADATDDKQIKELTEEIQLLKKGRTLQTQEIQNLTQKLSDTQDLLKKTNEKLVRLKQDVSSTVKILMENIKPE